MVLWQAGSNDSIHVCISTYSCTSMIKTKIVLAINYRIHHNKYSERNLTKSSYAQNCKSVSSLFAYCMYEN